MRARRGDGDDTRYGYASDLHASNVDHCCKMWLFVGRRLVHKRLFSRYFDILFRDFRGKPDWFYYLNASSFSVIERVLVRVLHMTDARRYVLRTIRTI